MIEPKNSLKNKFSNPTKTGRETSPKTEDEQTRNWFSVKDNEKTSHYYGIERGNRYVQRFKLLFRDGRVISMPYAHLPVFDYDPVGMLKIQTSEINVMIKGRALNKLLDWFNEQKVLWIKESASGIDGGEEAIFIQSIELQDEDDL